MDQHDGADFILLSDCMASSVEDAFDSINNVVDLVLIILSHLVVLCKKALAVVAINSTAKTESNKTFIFHSIYHSVLCVFYGITCCRRLGILCFLWEERKHVKEERKSGFLSPKQE